MGTSPAEDPLHLPIIPYQEASANTKVEMIFA
jgi:hypothetical protein